jgi:hypothetical protein
MGTPAMTPRTLMADPETGIGIGMLVSFCEPAIARLPLDAGRKQE